MAGAIYSPHLFKFIALRSLRRILVGLPIHIAVKRTSKVISLAAGLKRGVGGNCAPTLPFIFFRRNYASNLREAGVWHLISTRRINSGSELRRFCFQNAYQVPFRISSQSS